jgi:formate hydrogenlyase transcriptional activator
VRHALGERIKELTALHGAAQLLHDSTLSIPDLLSRIAALLPPAFQHADVACAEVRFGNDRCRTPGYVEGPWRLGAGFTTESGTPGSVEVRYVDERPAAADGPFLAEERHLVDSLAEMLRAALQQREVEADLKRSERELQAALAEATAQSDRTRFLLALTNAISSTLEIGTLLERISALLREVIPEHLANLALWDDDAGVLRRVGPVGGEAHDAGWLPDVVPAGWPSDVVFRTGETLVAAWADRHRFGESFCRAIESTAVRSGCGVPLQTPRRRYGSLFVASPEDRDYPPHEVRMLEQIGQQFAVAIENALHFATAERYRTRAAAERDRLQLLLDLTNAITSELELKDLIPAVSRLLETRLAHHFVSVTLWDAEARRLRRHALVFPNGQGVIQTGALVADNAPSHLVYLSGETRVFRWADIVALGEPVAGIMTAEGLRTICCVPLQTPRARHGTINVARPDDVPFDDAEVSLLEQIARQIAIAIENAVAFDEISALKDRLTEEKIYLQGELTARTDFSGITGGSRALRAVLDQIRTVAPTDATVLLLGETGTGKEVVARAIHDASRRRQQTFVRVNAAALPSALVESELFGYERGAFTGAAGSKAGRIELANRGTLFLDEIGDMPIDVQPKLLRALQEHEFERLGSTRTQRVDIRLIAATNRQLEAMVEAGTFRRDLFYRLNVFPIELPPLRDRPEDIPALVEHFVAKFAGEMGRTITHVPAAALRQLQDWPWPGNIRELQNVIERAVILSPGDTLLVPPGVFRSRPAAAPAAPVAAAAVAAAPQPRETPSFRDAERDTILRALRDARGVIGGPDGAAARLGVKRTTLNSKMRKLGITRPTY